jgi:hypothetical protein
MNGRVISKRILHNDAGRLRVVRSWTPSTGWTTPQEQNFRSRLDTELAEIRARARRFEPIDLPGEAEEYNPWGQSSGSSFSDGSMGRPVERNPRFRWWRGRRDTKWMDEQLSLFPSRTRLVVVFFQRLKTRKPTNSPSSAGVSASWTAEQSQSLRKENDGQNYEASPNRFAAEAGSADRKSKPEASAPAVKLVANFQDDRPECLRCSIATALGVREDAIPRLDHGSEDWFGAFADELERTLGVQLEPVNVAHLPTNTGEPWIAVLGTADDGENHAVVMRYGQIIFDPDDHWRGTLVSQGGSIAGNLAYGLRLRKVALPGDEWDRCATGGCSA